MLLVKESFWLVVRNILMSHFIPHSWKSIFMRCALLVWDTAFWTVVEIGTSLSEILFLKKDSKGLGWVWVWVLGNSLQDQPPWRSLPGHRAHHSAARRHIEPKRFQAKTDGASRKGGSGEDITKSILQGRWHFGVLDFPYILLVKFYILAVFF